MISNRDQVKGAIQSQARALTIYEVFQSCDCFADKKEAADLLRQMVSVNELTSFRHGGDAHPRYALPGMSFQQPEAPKAAPRAPKMADDAGERPNAEEMALARRVAPVEALPTLQERFDMDANQPRARRELIIKETTPGTAAMPNPDAKPIIIGAHHRVVPLEQQDARDTDEVLELLRAHLTEDEFRGYCRGNLIALSLRGRPEDLKRQSVFGQALAGVA